MKSPKVIVSGGGTGGHIFPAIAIANAISLKYPNADILFVGAEGKMEMEKVPKSGYPIEGLWISGIQRKLTLSNLSFPLKLISSLWKSRKIIKRFNPDICIGVGGFASGPLLKAATWADIPTLIHESNSYPGITNKLFVEIGVGDGLENNTHNLILNDWNGIWIDSNKKQINKLQNLINENNKLIISSSKITKKNINNEIKESLYKLIDKTNIQKENIDFFSIDIDSLDIFCVSNLEIVQPRLICIEYNAKFPPPVKWKIEYEKDHKWKGDDYFGASLSTYNDFFEKNGYKLICCNAHTGANAYFIKKEFINLFQDVPDEIDDLYMKPRYLLNNYLRFPISLKTINKFFS